MLIRLSWPNKFSDPLSSEIAILPKMGEYRGTADFAPVGSADPLNSLDGY